MIYDVIKDNIKSAMKDKNTVLKDTLKLTQARAQMIAKELKSDITDDVVIEAINKELKQLNQTLDSIKSKPECDLYKSTLEKIVILKSYIPAQMSVEDIESAIQKIKEDNKDTPVNKLIGTVMKELKGKADNGTIKDVFNRLTK